MKTTQLNQVSQSIEQWEQTWRDTVIAHFNDARSRVDLIHGRHFSSPKTVCLRHWRNKKDVPQDLLNLPIGLWHMIRSATQYTTQRIKKGIISTRQRTFSTTDSSEVGTEKPSKPPTMNGKERQLLKVLEEELFDLPGLQLKAWQHLRQHPELTQHPDWTRLLTLLAPYSDQASQSRLAEGLKHLAITHEGARDLALFIGLGVLGKSFGHSFISSGAMTLGASAASSVYISQQGWLTGLWIKWAGAPAWVATTGAATGMGLALLATPFISPLSELAINHWRGKKHLHTLINATETQISVKKDSTTLAGHAGTFVQLLPDLLQILKQCR